MRDAVPCWALTRTVLDALLARTEVDDLSTSRSPSDRTREVVSGVWGGSTIALDTLTLISVQYALEEDAIADYEAVRAVYLDLDITVGPRNA
jgi:hypothetical protein